jgi:hypothetical protein
MDATCWGLLWYDPSVKPELPADQPLWWAFDTTGFAGARTGWDEDALTLHLRSGKAHVSHSHLDVNNFLLNAGGEWLLHDYGYGRAGPGYFSKQTIYFNTSTWSHNCLVIGGRDQRVATNSVGMIARAEEHDGVVWFKSDATRAYEGTTLAMREIALVMPSEHTGKWGYVVVRDRAKTKEPETFDFMLNPGGEVELDGDTFTIRCEHSRLFGRVLSPKGVAMSVTPGIGERINVESPLSLRISAPGRSSEIEFVVVLVPLAEGEETPTISPVDGETAGVLVDVQQLTFSPDGASPPRRSVR